ncbi:hypothetical protein [Gimesia aquarii]|uniref:Uncharacterized protein n=1 Tax=Gimesia aquarii TaxID=2527964 RepID=A0A517X064_9PLAN|nr:hypothetical protein [Gimesia aquarii]QDU10895.1 hypothetical protein V202x_43080 [Gimesia aquarii]
MTSNDTTPATKADIEAVLSKLDTLATKDALSQLEERWTGQMTDGFAVVNERLDVLNKDMLAIVNNLANNFNKINDRLEDHETRIGQLEEGNRQILRPEMTTS